MSDQLSQEEIDALLNGGGSDTGTAMDDPADGMELNQDVKDIIGEVGNISMSQAATTLSQLLNRTVNITTPVVNVVSLNEIIQECEIPKVVTTINYKEGLEGNNLLMVDVNDAIIIADLMMGNDGTNVDGNEFSELELSAVAEAMNQMVGSASTAMATMFARKIDISPPQVEKWEHAEQATLVGITDENVVCRTSFRLSVEGLIDSEIMQIFPIEVTEEIAEIMLGDEAEVLAGREQPNTEKAESSSEQIESTPTVESVKPKEEVTVKKPAFQELEDTGKKSSPRNLDLIMDVPLDFSVVLGQSKKTIKDVLSLSTGSVVELDKMTDEPLEIYVNGQLIAEGEVVVINESFGIRITNILSKEQRIRHLK
jgi:flagellar motor switch protein FliN/FliY